MEITLVHLTDIHFSKKTDLKSKTEPLARAILTELGSSSVLYFVISGDITFSGKPEEYEMAKKYLSLIKTLLKGAQPNLEIHYIVVPGNHDLNFDYNTQVRINSLNNMNYDSIGEDKSVINICLEAQKDFWNFYENYRSVPQDKMFYKISNIHAGKTVNFYCLNTAWMSQIDEKVGSIFFPIQKYLPFEKEEGSINFGVWHHPYNWFNPNTVENNKHEFEMMTQKISSTHFVGHEHLRQFQERIDRDENNQINLLSGSILNEDKKPNKSEFQIIKFHIGDKDGTLTNLSWKVNQYERVSEKGIVFYQEFAKKFQLSKEFLTRLEELKIPIIIENKKDLKLSDLFIFPDLESTFNDSDKLDNHFQSNKLLNTDDRVIIIDGESQIGKSSLVSMLCLKFYEKNINPIVLTGKDFKEPNIEKTVKKAFNNQYEKGSNYETFRQLDNKRKVLLVDDYQECNFNYEATKKLLDSCLTLFEKVIVMFDSSNSVLSTLRLEYDIAKYYTIKPFGYKRRNDLIERYYYLNRDPNRTDEQEILIEVKNTFDNVQSILGERLIPSYPVYILSIIQALDYKPLKHNETSFAYCYQTLIHYSLYKAGVKNEDIDTYLNFLTEFAYKLVDSDTEGMTEREFKDFYCLYTSKFICPAEDAILQNLKRAKILIFEDEAYKFSYNYIVYYLSAKKIADILYTNDGKKIIAKLFSKLEDERNANILVFITHHSKDISFIEDSLLNSMIVLDKSNPISLRRDDPFYDEIKEIAENLKNDILDSNKNPKKVREESLARRDKIENERIKNDDVEDSPEELKKIVIPIIHSFRSIEIIGQIIKNRKGSLEINRLSELVTEIYTTGFRTIGYYSELLGSMKEDLKKIVNNDIDIDAGKNEIVGKINLFLQMMSLKFCLSVFNKLVHCVGTQELREIYKKVAESLNSPASKLVTFSINSYYGKISVKEVKNLAEEFKDNIVALRILKSTVRFYVYNRNLDFDTKQRLASAAKMTIIPQVLTNAKR